MTTQSKHSTLRASGWGVAVIVAIIRCYQKHAPARLRRACRFTPTCSEYTILAVQKHGSLKGGIQSIRRLLACRPPNGGTDHP